MKPAIFLLLLPTAFCFAQAPKNELAFGLGGIPSLSRNSTPKLEAGSGVALQVNYGRRFFNGGVAAIYGEINMIASPLREVSTSIGAATHDFATLYITPGIRVKLLPAARISPWAVIGGGYGDYEQSTMRVDGLPNEAPRQLGRGVFDIGGGVDARVWGFLALRGEVRDFYTGSPSYNISAISGGQHNLVATAAFVLRWH